MSNPPADPIGQFPKDTQLSEMLWTYAEDNGLHTGEMPCGCEFCQSLIPAAEQLERQSINALAALRAIVHTPHDTPPSAAAYNAGHQVLRDAGFAVLTVGDVAVAMMWDE